MAKRKLTDKPATPITERKPLDIQLADLLKGESFGPSDEAVNATWLYSEKGKAPR